MDIHIMDEPEVPDDAPPIAVLPVMDQILTWIGFDNEATRLRLQTESFESFADILEMSDKDIRDLADSYTRRTVADERSIFGSRRTRYLTGLIHWVQDYERIGEQPTIEGIASAAEFRAALPEANQRANVRKVEKDQSDTVSKAADPGKFKDERKWSIWEPAFANCLSTIPGVNGIPLSYVIRELEAPNRTAEFTNFNEKAIACAPLTGATYQADARKVHQLLKSYLQAETAEQWIKPLEKAKDGRKDMEALRNHYSGEGNTSRRIAVAERYRDSLHYKNEKALNFTGFLDKIQTMFNIFETEGEPVTEQAKIRMLRGRTPPQRSRNVRIICRLSFLFCRIIKSIAKSQLPRQEGKSRPSAFAVVEMMPPRWRRNAKESKCLTGPFGPAIIPIGRPCLTLTSRPSWIPERKTRRMEPPHEKVLLPNAKQAK